MCIRRIEKTPYSITNVDLAPTIGLLSSFLFYLASHAWPPQNWLTVDKKCWVGRMFANISKKLDDILKFNFCKNFMANRTLKFGLPIKFISTQLYFCTKIMIKDHIQSFDFLFHKWYTKSDFSIFGIEKWWEQNDKHFKKGSFICWDRCYGYGYFCLRPSDFNKSLLQLSTLQKVGESW